MSIGSKVVTGLAIGSISYALGTIIQTPMVFNCALAGGLGSYFASRKEEIQVVAASNQTVDVQPQSEELPKTKLDNPSPVVQAQIEEDEDTWWDNAIAETIKHDPNRSPQVYTNLVTE